MDRIAIVLKYQWRAYWRRFRTAGNFSRNNVGLLVLLGGLGVVRYLQQLPLAATQLGRGETARYETLLIVVFLVWMLPVMAESRRSIESRDLLHLPLGSKHLFVIRLCSVFCSPLTWAIVIVSLSLSYVAAMAQHPLTGLMALFTFLLLGLFTSLTIAHLLHSALARKSILALTLIVSAGVALLWLGDRTKLVAPLKSLLPSRLTAAAAVSAAPLYSLALLVGATVVVALLALWTFILSLQPQQNQRSQSFTVFSFMVPGRVGGLLKKDLRYSRRLLDLYLALPIVIFFNMYLVSDTAPSAVVFAVIIGILFLPFVSMAFNCFGLDSPLGLDRYALFPLSAKEKLLSKDLAFASVMIILFLTLLPLAFWKLSVSTVLFGFMEFVVVGLAYITYGNWMSVKHPFKMQFYRFASGGSPVDALMGIIFGSIPGLCPSFCSIEEM